ncbi:MAG: hypothetical protein WBC93_22260 [Sulfitobacter sp.]
MHILIVPMVLAGCLPLSIYHRPGVTVARAQSETTRCEVSALARVPVANQIHREPPEFVPGRRVCDASGACTTGPGYFIPGEIYTVDVNRELRGRVEAQCMAAKGYKKVKIPACAPGTATAGPPQATSVLPNITPQSCVIRHKGSGWQIVNRAK